MRVALPDLWLRVQGPSHLRPGFELGYMEADADKPKMNHYYIFNHLVFNVLIHKTHGEYTQSQSIGAALALEDSGRRLLGWPESTPPTVVDALKAHSARTLSAVRSCTRLAPGLLVLWRF